ncbi:MAG: MsnO8 family LLM class oxidoreductase, partial [Rhizobiales bacterium]|nr:MsnO8 family LLM class oxidoreductase [Hyphomicrobiales bacterium]
PGRIDLGLGRAPGTDQLTMRALRRSRSCLCAGRRHAGRCAAKFARSRNLSGADTFPQDVLELQALLGPLQPGQRVQAVPGTDTNVPLWILGSSLFGAQLAAMLGLPYAFASHFAPDALMPALDVYRAKFQSSAQLDRPYAMVGVNVIAADTDAAARRLFTSAQQTFTNMFRGTRGKLPPPIDEIETYWTPMEKAQASSMLSCSVVGSPDTVRRGVQEFAERTGAEELIIATAVYDHQARLRSYEILAEVTQRG